MRPLAPSPGPGAPNVKERRYGSARLLDGERGPEIEFVRSVGLGVGDRVRWYVEGKTEYWALAQFFGSFSISDPDFELGNFSLEELEKIMWEMAEEGGATEGARQELHDALVKVEEKQQKKGEPLKGKHVIKAAADNVLELNQLSKNEEWGQRLMAYANEYPQSTHGKDRPVTQAIGFALQSLRDSYIAMRRALRVDPKSGDLKAEVPDLSGARASTQHRCR